MPRGRDVHIREARLTMLIRLLAIVMVTPMRALNSVPGGMRKCGGLMCVRFAVGFAFALYALASFPTSASAKCFWCYAAIATSLDGSHVAMGVSYGDTQDDADSTALEKCGHANGASCRVVYRFWHGACGAVAIGHNDQTGRVAWGTGKTRTEAMQNCIGEGASCTLNDYRCTPPPVASRTKELPVR
jgi:hypothetical protein